MRKEKSTRSQHVWKHERGLFYVERKDARYTQYKQIQKETGVSPDETWSLDITFANFILPRLKMYRDRNAKGQKDIDKMIDAFTLILQETANPSEDEKNRIEQGLDLFKKHMLSSVRRTKRKDKNTGK